MSSQENNNTLTPSFTKKAFKWIKELYVLIFTIPKSQPKKPYIEKPKDVTLYSQDGEIIKEYKGVYPSHWDTNIYHIYKNSDHTGLIERIDKGANMMLSYKCSSN